MKTVSKENIILTGHGQKNKFNDEYHYISLLVTLHVLMTPCAGLSLTSIVLKLRKESICKTKMP